VLPGFSIIITPDSLKAYLQIPPKATVFPVARDLQIELQNKGIIIGIDHGAIQQVASGKIGKGLIEIAKGVAPQAGNPGRIEILIDVSQVGIPRELVDGRVDHHEIGTVINVKKGFPLARHIPPGEGIDGRNIFGKPIAAPLPDDVPLHGGSGTCISSNDKNILLSEIDGAVSIRPDGFIEVKNQKIIEMDIDYSTGNINFPGDLIIKGSVRAGFFVEVLGNLHVLGSVEDTQIKSMGNVEIDGGVVGAGTGLIECRGFVKVRHLENFSIKSGENVFISEDALHSTISADGRIKAKSIIGGTITAFGIECDSVGSTAETKTILDIGKFHALSEERSHLKKKNVETSDLVTQLNVQIFSLVRDSMDEKGMLSELEEKKLESLKNKTMESKRNCDKIRARIDCINKTEQTFGAYCGLIAKCVFPNTLIKFGNGERQVQDILYNIKLSIGK
jgi:uncharacterized protein (DUF342 family)